MGSARNVIPPWGGKSRLGNGVFTKKNIFRKLTIFILFYLFRCFKVLSWVVESIKARASQCGPDTVNHEVTVFDPLDVFGPDGALSSSGAEMKCPHFFMKTDEVSPELAAMAATIKAADCFIIVTPEYNHTLPPALTSMMGHFGSSNYAFKPSAIVTYSVGALGGIRAAMAARPFLSELGCLPVSKLAAFGSVGTPTIFYHYFISSYAQKDIIVP